MLQNLKKALAFICALSLLVTAQPVTADAAAKPKFSKTYASLYENSGKGGVYTYTVKNLTKGQTVKWSISGTGKSYAKLKKTTTKATSTKVSNTVTINTKGKTAAKLKTVNVKAKVYTKAGKLQCTLSAGDAKIKVVPTDIQIVDTALPDTLQVGKSCQFKYQITPANATTTLVWTASRQNGSSWIDCSDCITKAGVFTPKDDGAYKITVQATVSKKVKASASTNVTVSPTFTEAKLTAADKVTAVYSGDARELVKKTSFTLKDSSGAKENITDIAFSADGKEVTLTVSTILKNGGTYTLTDGIMSHDISVKYGKPIVLKCLTTEVVANRSTPIRYGIYDENEIEVSAAYPGKITYTAVNLSGCTLENDKLTMKNIGSTCSFIMNYACESDSKLVLKCSAQVTCVAASASANTNFTLTTSSTAPDYSAATYADNRKVAVGKTYYMHFRALDADNSEFKYDAPVTYKSSDPDTLMINNYSNGTAQATALKTGTVTVTVTAVYGDQTFPYDYQVEVVSPAYLASISMDNIVMYVSNRNVTGYQKYLNVTALDQNGQSFDLAGESAVIAGANTYSLVDYDKPNNRVKITPGGCPAGTYNFTLTLTLDGHSAQVGFSVIVQTPSNSGTPTYQVDFDNPTMDLALSAGTDLNKVKDDKSITIRLAECYGGILYEDLTFQSAKIIKDGKYYSTNLTEEATKDEIPVGYNRLTLQTISFDSSKNECTKAPAGTYQVELKYYPTGSSTLTTITGSFTLTDSTSPTVTVERTTANEQCKTVLELAQNCLSVTGSDEKITDCTLTGSDKTGSSSIDPGESVHIKTVTVQITTVISGKNVISKYIVDVGKTLTNL